MGDADRWQQRWRRPLLMLLVIALLVVAVAAWRPWKDGNAEGQAKLAKRDALWSAAPPGLRLQGKYVVLADASWVPWGGDITSVGRWYDVTAGRFTSASTSWDAAARATGWTPGVVGFCHGYTKRLGHWMALLTIGPDETKEFLGVRVSFNRGTSTSNCT